MFLNHFGLRKQPFGVTRDPHFLYFSPAQKVIDESVLNEVVEDLEIKTLRSNSSNEWLCGGVEPVQPIAQNRDLACPKWTGQAAVSSIAGSRSKINAGSNAQDDCSGEKPSADNCARWSAEKWIGGMTHEQEC